MQVVLAINPDDKRTLQAQIFEEIKRMILEGTLRSGDPVPGSRALSEQLGVSRNTIIIAYDKLLSEGYIESRANVGTFVSTHLPDIAIRANGSLVPAPVPDPDLDHDGFPAIPLSTTLPDVQSVTNPDAERMQIDFWIGKVEPKAFPTREWRRILDAKLRYGTKHLSAYGDPQGLPALRQAIADHIGPARGIPAEPEDVLVIGGSQDGLSLIARAFQSDLNTFLHEDPCYQGARFVFQGFGYNCIPGPLDAGGIAVDRLPETGRTLLYVTPSHQYPIGMTMTLERRLRLLDWAERTDSLIVEDDYDGEFRYEGAPLTALRGLDRTGRVIYLGTFSKSFGPGLRLGFIIASPGALRVLRRWKQLCSNSAPWLEQAAMGEFIGGGGFRRHLRRIRALYMRRRDTLLTALADHFPTAQTTGHRAGMHLSWCLPDQSDLAARHELLARLQRIGIYRPGSGGSWISPQNRRHRDHLLMGYAAVDEKQIQQAVAVLAACRDDEGNQPCTWC